MSRPALWRYLWRWTMVALGIAWVTLMVASYYAGRHEAEEITDAHLASAVNVLLQVSAFGSQPGDPSTIQIPVEREFASFIPLGRHLNFTRSMAVIVWDNGLIVADSRPLNQRWPITQPDGYSTFAALSGSEKRTRHWRMFAAERAGSSRRAAAMIDLEQRAWIGRHVAITIARPALIVLPLIAILLWWAMQRGLQPLNTLSARVAGLNLKNGERLDHAPRFAEFDSMVRAINGLIDKLQAQVSREREFASDVAHELRTPLSVIALQSQNAANQPDPADRATALAALQHEALRAGRILGELLDLARAQSREDDAPQEVDLGELAARVMAGFAQASHDSGHVLELASGPEPVVVQANPLLLELALGNLITNALVHTGRGTVVEIAVAQGPAGRRLAVSDNGQRGGDTRARDALPNAAATGLGIGLKLVQRIATIHHAELVRDAGEPPMTTRFSLRWTADAGGA